MDSLSRPDKVVPHLPKESRVRIVSISPDIVGTESTLVGLFLQTERCLHQAAERLGFDYAVIGGGGARQPPDFPAVIVPSDLPRTEYSLDSTQWPRLWHSREYRTQCGAILDAVDRIQAGDVDDRQTIFLLYHGHPCHLPALIRLGLAMGGRSPIVINLYWLHFVYGLHRPQRVPWLRTFLRATRRLRQAANVHLRVDSARLAELIYKDTGKDFPVLPFFSPMGERAAVDKAGPLPDDVLRIVYPTALPGRDKGFDLVIGLAERLGRDNVEIIARENEGATTEICLPTLRAHAGGLRLLKSFLPEAGYQAMLSMADIVLVPYAAWQFHSRTSGVVADAISLGKPLVGTSNTWIGDQIDLVGGGTTFDDGNVDDLVEAVKKAIDDLDVYRGNLATRGTGWLQKNTAEALITDLAGTGTRNNARLSKAKEEACHIRLAALTDVFIPSLRDISIPCRVLANQIRQRLQGTSGSLILREIPAIRKGRGWERLPAIAWQTRGVKNVELRLDAHDGFLVGRGDGRGAIWPTFWIHDRRHIYLQDVSKGRQLLPKHTLGRIQFHSLFNAGGGTTIAHPSYLRRQFTFWVRRICRLGNGKLEVALPSGWSGAPSPALLAWRCRGVSSEVEIRAEGRLFTRNPNSGRAETPAWVVKGTTFELWDTNPRIPKMLRLLDTVSATNCGIGATARVIDMTDRARQAAGALLQFSHTSENTLSDSVGVGVIVNQPSASNGSPQISVGSNEWGVIVPPSTGEVYLIAAHARAFLDKYGGDKLVIFAPAAHLDLLRLFPDAPVRGEVRPGADFGELETRRQIGRVIRLDYGLGVTITSRYVMLGRYDQHETGFVQMFLEEAGLRVGSGMVHGLVSEQIREAARHRMRELQLVEGRTVLLSPSANSVPPPELKVWAQIANELTRRGFSVATNCGPGEELVPGSIPWTGPLSELYATAELGGYFMSARNGLCDILSNVKTNLHILQVDFTLVPFPGIALLSSLAENGLPDTAEYHVMGLDETAQSFADRVTAHPDFRGA